MRGELLIRRPDGRRQRIDVVREATITRTVMLPKHPVDPGSAGGTGRLVNDSAREGPIDISILCTMSATAPAGALPDPRREEAIIEFLEAIVGEYVTITLPRGRVFTDVQLAGFPHKLDSKSRTPFNLTFSRIGFAGRSVTQLPRVVPRAKADLPPEENIGTQPTTTATPEQEAKVKPSIAKRSGRKIREAFE